MVDQDQYHQHIHLIDQSAHWSKTEEAIEGCWLPGISFWNQPNLPDFSIFHSRVIFKNNFVCGTLRLNVCHVFCDCRFLWTNFPHELWENAAWNTSINARHYSFAVSTHHLKTHTSGQRAKREKGKENFVRARITRRKATEFLVS